MNITMRALFLVAVGAFPLSDGFQPHSVPRRGKAFVPTTLRSSSVDDVPSTAQTHFQGPLTVNGSGKALTKVELDSAKEELASILSEYGWKEPDRAFMDDPDTKWRFGGPPDYSLTNLLYLKERSKIHPDGSLEQIVENLVKTWEMERSHKLDYNQHQSVDTEKFQISANGGKVFNNAEANEVGNYNVLLNSCPAETWDSANISWEDSHDIFHDSFAAFPWEVLEVFSGPPKVAFSWRHWGHFTGTFGQTGGDLNKGEGQLVEVYGFGTAVVNDALQLVDVEIYYDAEQFISVMRGETTVEEANSVWNKNPSCPFMNFKKGDASEGSAEKKEGKRQKLVRKVKAIFA